jgi:FAD synthetase
VTITVIDMPMSAQEAADEQSPVTSNGVDTSIRPLCLELAARVNRFLEAEAETPVLRAVQAQTQAALGVVTAALERYRYVASYLYCSRSASFFISESS